MTTQTDSPSNDTSDIFDVGWVVLLVISGLALLNHILLPFYDANNIVVAIGWVGWSVYATLVLAVPFRRGEKWAWYSTWLLVIGFASLILLDVDIELSGVVTAYVMAAVVMALCLLLTRPAFFQSK